MFLSHMDDVSPSKINKHILSGNLKKQKNCENGHL